VTARRPPGAAPEGQSWITIERVVEWYDTDAAGHQHHSAIMRWAEAAEAELLRRHGLDGLFGRTPRVRYEVNYRAKLTFGQTVRILLRVADIGRTSLRYVFEVRTAADAPAADGVIVIVHTGTPSSPATPWPEEIVAALRPDG
jgi:acyl-CoA thioester hydrolase